MFACLATMWALWLSYWLHQMLADAIGARQAVGYGISFLFFSVLTALPLYAALSRWVMRASGLSPVRGEFIGRGAYQILSILLFLQLMVWVPGVLEHLTTDTVLDLFLIFIPYALPYLCYQMALKYLVVEPVAVAEPVADVTSS